jgi:hypothetical protein
MLHDGFDVDMSLQRILQELGRPFDILTTSVGLSESGDSGQLEVLMLYEQGIIFYHIYLVPIGLDDNQSGSASAEVCLGSDPISSSIFLLEPFQDNLSNLSPVQDGLIGDIIESGGLAPIQDKLDVSVDDILNLANQENPCFRVDPYRLN